MSQIAASGCRPPRKDDCVAVMRSSLGASPPPVVENRNDDISLYVTVDAPSWCVKSGGTRFYDNDMNQVRVRKGKKQTGNLRLQGGLKVYGLWDAVDHGCGFHYAVNQSV